MEYYGNSKDVFVVVFYWIWIAIIAGFGILCASAGVLITITKAKRFFRKLRTKNNA